MVSTKICLRHGVKVKCLLGRLQLYICTVWTQSCHVLKYVHLEVFISINKMKSFTYKWFWLGISFVYIRVVQSFKRRGQYWMMVGKAGLGYRRSCMKPGRLFGSYQWAAPWPTFCRLCNPRSFVSNSFATYPQIFILNSFGGCKIIFMIILVVSLHMQT